MFQKKYSEYLPAAKAEFIILIVSSHVQREAEDCLVVLRGAQLQRGDVWKKKQTKKQQPSFQFTFVTNAVRVKWKAFPKFMGFHDQFFLVIFPSCAILGGMETQLEKAKTARKKGEQTSANQHPKQVSTIKSCKSSKNRAIMGRSWGDHWAIMGRSSGDHGVTIGRSWVPQSRW